MIRIVYLARLRDSLGIASESIDLPADVATVTGLLAWLGQRGGVWAREFAPGRAFRIAVNHDIAQQDTAIRAGDEVAFFPPVTGG